MSEQSVAASAPPTRSPGFEAAHQKLYDASHTVVRFAADREGGRALETYVRDGRAVGVLDLTTAELAAELLHGTAAGSNRLTAAALAGVPQVISLGGLDAVAAGPGGGGLRTTPEQNDRLGQEVAMKACAARGPTAIVVPLRGLSSLDTEGGPNWWPEANAALFQSLRNWVYGVELIELDLHVNDPEFGVACAGTLLRLLGGTIVRE